MSSSVSKRELPLPKELWARIPPDIQAALQVLSEGYEQRIATLAAELAALTERVKQNSQNSSRPPSSEGPGVKRRPPPEPSGRKAVGSPAIHPIRGCWSRSGRCRSWCPVRPHSAGAVGSRCRAGLRLRCGSK